MLIICGTWSLEFKPLRNLTQTNTIIELHQLFPFPLPRLNISQIISFVSPQYQALFKCQPFCNDVLWHRNKGRNLMNSKNIYRPDWMPLSLSLLFPWQFKLNMFFQTLHFWSEGHEFNPAIATLLLLGPSAAQLYKWDKRKSLWIQAPAKCHKT